MKYVGLCPSCKSYGFEEFGGMCAVCWSDSDPEEQQAILVALGRGDNIPPAVHEHHHHQHIYPPQSRLVTTLIAIVAGAAGAAVCFYFASP
jgi:hypothetical protein